MDYQYLTIERRGHIALVTLNRSEKLNALSIDLMKEIEKAAEEFQDDVETRVVIFTGAGKHFSAGRDLRDPKTAEAEKESLLARQRRHHIGPRMISKLTAIDQIPSPP